MVPIPKKTLSPTVEAIYAHYVEKNGDHRRDHLGASLIGTECSRSLWMTFRWCSDPAFIGRMLRLFQTGNVEETRVIKNLKDIGIEIYPVDPATGRQIHYGSAFGHYSGSLDAIGKKFIEAPETWHVVEIKSSNLKSFTALEKNGVKKEKPLHFAQMQAYLHWSELERAMYFCVCKDNDEIYEERVYYDKEFAKSLEEKAKRIIFSDSPLPRITDDPDAYECKYCSHKDSCHVRKLPDVSCRTCAWSTPREDGKWYCDRKNTKLTSSEQRHPCDQHIFIPDLIPFNQTDADAEKGTITYGLITNGPGAIASTDLQDYVDGKKKVPCRCPPSEEPDRSAPFVPYEPDMSGVAYDTEFTGF